jgi:hypothetical protein
MCSNLLRQNKIPWASNFGTFYFFFCWTKMLWQVTKVCQKKRKRPFTHCLWTFLKMWGDRIKTPNSLPYRTKFGRKVSVSAFTQAFFDQFQLVRLISDLWLRHRKHGIWATTTRLPSMSFLTSSSEFFITSKLWYEKNFRTQLQFSLVEICYSGESGRAGPVPYSSLLGFKPSKQPKKKKMVTWGLIPHKFFMYWMWGKKRIKKNLLKNSGMPKLPPY